MLHIFLILLISAASLFGQGRNYGRSMVITQQGMVVRTSVDAIRIVGRNTQGVKVMTPNEGDKIATLAKLANEPKPEADANPAADEPGEKTD